MAKQNVLVKLSGNLLKNRNVLAWLKTVTEINSVVIVCGGGEDINRAFKERGFEIKFGPMGRITKTLEEKQIARDILEFNQTFVQDLFDQEGIYARAVIPVRDVGTVLCHENGDVMVLSAYNGFDKIYILTLKSRKKEKSAWLKKLGECFQHIEKGDLDKIEVVGF